MSLDTFPTQKKDNSLFLRARQANDDKLLLYYPKNPWRLQVRIKCAECQERTSRCITSISSWKCTTQVHVYLVARQSSLCCLLAVIFIVVLEGGGKLCAYMLANVQLPCPRWWRMARIWLTYEQPEWFVTPWYFSWKTVFEGTSKLNSAKKLSPVRIQLFVQYIIDLQQKYKFCCDTGNPPPRN